MAWARKNYVYYEIEFWLGGHAFAILIWRRNYAYMTLGTAQIKRLDPEIVKPRWGFITLKISYQTTAIVEPVDKLANLLIITQLSGAVAFLEVVSWDIRLGSKSQMPRAYLCNHPWRTWNVELIIILVNGRCLLGPQMITSWTLFTVLDLLKITYYIHFPGHQFA